MPPEPLPESTTEVPPPITTSLLSRMFNVFAAPGEVFEEVKASPPSTANWFAPALIYILIGWIGGFMIMSQEGLRHQMAEMREKPIQKRVEQGKMTQQQADQALAASEKFADIFTKIIVVLGPVVMAFTTPFWWAFFMWLVGAKFLHGNFSYMKAVEVAGLVNMIEVLEAIVRSLLVLALGNLLAAPSPMLLIHDFDPQNTVHGALSTLNILVLWALGVRAIGVSKLAGVSFGKALGWLVALWVAWYAFWIAVGAAIQKAFA